MLSRLFGREPVSPKVKENGAYLKKHKGLQSSLNTALNAAILAQGRAWPEEVDPRAYMAAALRVLPELGPQLAALDLEHLLAARVLIDIGQGHLFKGWAPAGKDDDRKRAFFAQVAELERAYPGGLKAYRDNAVERLKEAKDGANPFDGWTPEVPTGERIAAGSDRFFALERVGMDVVGHTAFVLVAGGLGERLGYNGIKVALPVDSATGISMLEWYAQWLLAFQSKAGGRRKVQLAIMTSDDTHAKTEAFLAQHNHFGLDPAQVVLTKQGKVPALADNEARFAREGGDVYSLETKPHGHGDVHSLLWKDGIIARWTKMGVKYVAFFQDTNPLAFRAFPVMLGVSVKNKFAYNSLTVPRTAGEAVGGIAKLRHTDGRTLTINVEYNQLDPLLRATTHPEGDAPDASGFSPFPGNINVLVLALGPYSAALKASGGRMPEFVNPKYADGAREAFLKPTRLECMMQDFPKVLRPGDRVGFTQLDRWLCFSPVKNAVADAAKKAAKGLPPECAASGEADMYNACAKMLAASGVRVEAGPTVEWQGVPVRLTPVVHLSPSFATTWGEVAKKVKGGSISAASALVVSGDAVIKGLDLDGAMVLRPTGGAAVRFSGYHESNAGWAFEPLGDGEASEVDRMKGYRLVKRFAHVFAFSDNKEHVLSN